MLASAAWAVARVRAERDQACTERDQVRQQLIAERARLESIVDAAHQYADDHDLCERFDEFMVEHGLRPRRRDYIVELDATVRVSVNVSGRNGPTPSPPGTGMGRAFFIVRCCRCGLSRCKRRLTSVY